MRDFIYNTGIQLYYQILSIVALFHPKAKLFIDGRKDILIKLANAINEKPGNYIWIHAASLGEFEQGRPLIEALRKKHKDRYRILLTFYSPSGYEIRKDYELADVISYLPIDSSKMTSGFLDIVKPKLGILIKYEFWTNYINECKERNIPLFSISSIFRSNQVYFKSKGKFLAEQLKSIEHFYVQNASSKSLLKSIDISQVTIAGDTRFDRVQRIVAQSKEVPVADRFTNDQPTMVLGSLWEEDLKVLMPFISQHIGELKFIIAPHNIAPHDIETIEQYLSGISSVRFSSAETATVAEFDVLIIDNMGMLSSLYRYGQYAYIGGAFGKGLHNILEAVTWQIPVFYGASKTNAKFDEVSMAENYGVAFPIESVETLNSIFARIQENEEEQDKIASSAAEFLKANTGATDKIMKGISEKLDG